MALVVSGGHTELVYMPEDGVSSKLFGETRDDAVWEVYIRLIAAPELHILRKEMDESSSS